MGTTETTAVATIEKCVEEQRAVRGTASTFSDVFLIVSGVII